MVIDDSTEEEGKKKKHWPCCQDREMPCLQTSRADENPHRLKALSKTPNPTYYYPMVRTY